MQNCDKPAKETQRIQPVEFTFGDKPATTKNNTSIFSAKQGYAKRQRLINVSISCGMAIALVMVFFGLPKIIDKPQLNPIDRPPSNSTNHRSAADKAQESPYSDAEIYQQRHQVQKVLQDIFQLQEELAERQVELWAAESYSDARTLAEQADILYRQRTFMQSLQKYQQALSALQAIRDSIPERIEQHLAEGNAALDSGNTEAAHKAFNLVLTISNNHPRGVKGKARAEILPQAWENFTFGKQAFEHDNLNQARDALTQALAIDPLTQPARELLPTVTLAITERDYREAMSAGYSALAQGDFAQAQAFFHRAQKLKPQAADPATGLHQAKNGVNQTHIDQLFVRAAQMEQQEHWHAAAESYRQLVKADKSLVQALTGRARTQARAKLDDQLQTVLSDPLSLGQSKRNLYARKVLANARALQAGTPRILGQIKHLQSALVQALIPVSVRLQSNLSTNVTIYHVGKFGNFSEREITLKPGRYTAVGTRQGYRDVRREFIVNPTGELPTVTIQCDERIISAHSS